MELITSRNNNLIKYLVKLQTSKFAKSENKTFVESEKLILQLVKQNLVDCIFIDQSKVKKYKHIIDEFKGKTYLINESIVNLIKTTTTTSGIFAVAYLKENSLDIASNCVLLDNIQDPTNLGAIIRSGYAFGVTNYIILGDIFAYSSKVVRASMGYVFNVNIINVTLEQLTLIISKNNYDLIVADMCGTELSQIKNVNKYILAIGNEGNGISQQVSKLSNKQISIKMLNNVESLNASISASLILYYLQNKF